MGMLIPNPPRSNKFNNGIEHIEQHQFVKKTEKEAITKHIPNDESEQSVITNTDEGVTIDTIKYESTSSYNPYTFTTEMSYDSALRAIENGKDTDLVAISVGEIRKMQERIRILETEVMKSKSVSSRALTSQTMLDIERERIKFKQQQIESNAKHKHQTELRKEEIKRQIAMSEGWERMFNS